VHLQLAQVLKLLAGLACGEHDPNRIGEQASGDERQRQRRGLIEPLRVIDHAQQRTVLGHLREQTEHGQSDEEPIRSRARAQPEHDLQRPALRRRKPPKPIEHRAAQLIQTRVGQLHLRLHAHCPHDRATVGRLNQVLHQRGLPDPGLPPQNQRPTLAASDVLEQPVQHSAFAGPPEQSHAPSPSMSTVLH
jgi:hypothetical protein